jgi:hypothetical protein
MHLDCRFLLFLIQRSECTREQIFAITALIPNFESRGEINSSVATAIILATLRKK